MVAGGVGFGVPDGGSPDGADGVTGGFGDGDPPGGCVPAGGAVSPDGGVTIGGTPPPPPPMGTKNGTITPLPGAGSNLTAGSGTAGPASSGLSPALSSGGPPGLASAINGCGSTGASAETSGGSNSATGAIGASEMRLPQRARINAWPSVTTFSPFFNSTLFRVQ